MQPNTVVVSALPAYAVGVSLAAAVLIMLSDKRENLREFWSIAASVVKFSLVASMLPRVLGGQVLEYCLFVLFPGLEVGFRVDALGVFFALAASFLWILTSFYSIGYMRAGAESSQTRYFACFAVALSSTIGVAFSSNLLTMFVFYEALTLCTFPLVGHRGDAESLAGARKYLVYLLGTSLSFLMFAIVLTYFAAGTLEFTPGGILAGTAPKGMLAAIFVLFVLGTAKAAMMPLHSWLPSAMVAPAPVSALLHAVAVVKTGVFVMLRVVLYVFGPTAALGSGMEGALVFLASFTIIVASVIALRQDNLKAMLAYSTISQLSYIVLGAALLTPSAVTGGVMHIVLHAFGKITLFFTAGAIYRSSHKILISELDGLGRRMPLTMGAFTVAAVSMIGVPPLGGFVSKWFLIGGAVEAGSIPVVLVLASSTVLNACYFLPVIYRAYFKPLAQMDEGINEAPALLVGPLLLTATGAAALFFVPGPFLALARMVASSVGVGGF